MASFEFSYVFSEDGVPVVFGGVDVVWEGAPSTELRAQTGLVPYSPEEYAEAMAALLPTGPAWPRDPSSALMRIVAALAIELSRVDARAAQLLAEGDPATTTELLFDWERVVGLPDPCVTVAQTVADRRLALEGRLTALGSQSREFFIALAWRLGYTVTIDEFASATEATAAGITFTGSQWAHIWRVNVDVAVAVRPFRVGSGAAGEPLRSWGNQVLECQFNRFKPAHTQVLFAYAT